MYCTKCSAQMSDKLRFCTKCGTALPKSSQSNTNPPQPEPAHNPPAPPSPAPTPSSGAWPASGANPVGERVSEYHPDITSAPAVQLDDTKYTTLATQKTPALIIYLLDISASMERMLGNKRRIDLVQDALGIAVRQMVFRSTKGGRVSPRYRVAMLAYSDTVYDVLEGVKGVDEVAKMGLPDLVPTRMTNTALAFSAAEKLLQQELPGCEGCPAPLICHMTDGEYTNDDPSPIVERIKRMSVPDGSVLIENIFISDEILSQPIPDVNNWPGIMSNTVLKNSYAQKLRAMSSLVPKSYLNMMVEYNYRLSPGAVMLFPGTSPELIALGFQMSAATPVR